MALDTSQNRSTANSVQNSTFPDLSMTQYPVKIDSRVNSDSGYNKNMEGFINVQDATATTPLDKMYSMAEHVNALADAIMAVQRVLGIQPQLDVNGQSNQEGTVSGRIDILENPTRLDGRYGGANWITSQTLVGHTHTGETGHPSKIDLASHVQGILSKSHIDLAQTTGITGADLSMTASTSTKISDAIADKLSTSTGGTVDNNLTVTGKLQSRIQREWNWQDVTNGSKLSDNTTSSNVYYRIGGTSSLQFLYAPITNLEYGKYVVGVRLRTSSLSNEVVSFIRVFNNVNGTNSLNKSINIYGTDFDAVGTWKMFYMICDIEGDGAGATSHVQIAKNATSVGINIDFDHAFIMPVHPAIFDK